MIICLFWSTKALNVWKNSSWVLSFPPMNCTSSTIKTSTERNSSLKSIILRSRKACTKRYMNCSAERYITLMSGRFDCSSQAIECIKWVFPRPTPPYKNRGLKVTGPASATRFAAAWANSLGLPTTKFSNTKRWSSFAPCMSRGLTAATTAGVVRRAAGF